MSKPKRVVFQLITEHSNREIFGLLAYLVDNHHSDLKEARIALAWCSSWKPDADGRLTLGMCKRASDLDRELAPYDFVILLNKQFWTDVTVKDLQRQALLDHELCHAEVQMDAAGNEVARDEKGRPMYRMRKHDVEEFSEIIERYGLYKRDLEHFASALRRSKTARQETLKLVDFETREPVRHRKGSASDASAPGAPA